MAAGGTTLLENWLGLKAPLLWLLERMLMLWVRTTVLPEELEEAGIDRDKPVCYVLALDGITNTLVHNSVCEQLRLPDPQQQLHGFDDVPARIFLRRLSGVLVRRADPRISEELQELVQQFDVERHGDVQFVPVSIFWGRSPQKEDSVIKLLFTDSWSIAGRLRKMMIVLLHGRHTLVQFSKPVSLAQLADADDDPRLLPRKLSRVLRIHFRRLRAAAIGPDLSHKRLLVNEIVDSTGVKRVIEEEAQAMDMPLPKARQKARKKAIKFAKEIAADYSHPVIRVLETLLTWVWNSVYKGISVNNFATVKEMAQGNEIIYVPCHRSHADYLLLSYVLYKRGLVPPHIAAGINLNLPVVGSLLRRGGAFFIRRSFRGQKLYSTVFDAYLRRNLSKGVALEYFIEGTRSRTGKLLDPKGGMLSMTTRSYLKDCARPVVFIPVYFGYERLLEGRSYESELSGSKKQKESVWGLLKSVRILWGNFGKVYVNFSEPIQMDELLTSEWPDWNADRKDEASRDEILKKVVPVLGQQILVSINQAVAVNSVNLAGTVLLAVDHKALAETELEAQLDLYAALLSEAPYSQLQTLDETVSGESPGKSIIEYAEEFGVLERRTHELGDVIGLSPANGGMVNYYRNNTKHLFALSSLIACCFMTRKRLAREKIIRFVSSVYGLARGEYFLQWSTDEIDAEINRTIDQLVRHGLVIAAEDDENALRRPESDTPKLRQLDLLAHIYYATIERYSMLLNLLMDAGTETIRQSELESRCRLTVERLAMLNENTEGDYFDKRSFRRIIDSMMASGRLWKNDDRRLCFDETLSQTARRMTLVTDVPARRVSMHQ